MTIDRVDTTRPEYSWIPFFEELALRLHEDGWRDRQGEIVAGLQRMREDGVMINEWIEKMDDVIDPFSVFAMMRRNPMRFENAQRVMERYKQFFSITADLPREAPFNPTVPANNSFLFGGIPESDEIAPHWDLFELVMQTKSEDIGKISVRLEPRLNASVEVHGAGVATVTGALYWIDPHRFLKDDTIKAVLGNNSVDVTKGRFSASYINALKKVRESTDESFPSINNREWFLGKFKDDKNATSRTVWQTTAERGQTDRERYLDGGYVGMGWTIEDLTAVKNPDDLGRLTGLKGNQLGQVRHFGFNISAADVVILHSGEKGTYWWGLVNADRGYFEPDKPDGSDSANRRGVCWMPDPVSLSGLETGHFGALTRRGELGPNIIREILDSLADGPSGGTDIDPKVGYTVDTMLDEGVFLERSAIDDMLALLRRKQNLILQGPPGTGKTFIAKRLAYALMGERADDRIASVQFHQSYSYEDFVGGFRPSINEKDQLVFQARDGAFLRLCEKAREDTENDYVMLIDEINRGNLSRVFGELLMLIEADKREERHAVELQHREQMPDADTSFFVPPNIYIIGTMNLADRSLTGMNVAMRRRFAFRDLKPQFESPRFREWIQATGMPDYLQEHILTRLQALNAMIGEDASLGKQYAVGHSFFTPSRDGGGIDDWDVWYESVVEYEIRPLLEEYWFDQPEKADTEVGKLAKPQTDGTLESGEATDEDQD